MFNYGQNYYRQIEGSPIGSPCSPQLADLVTEILEENIFQKIAKPFFYIRYVDDSFIIINELEIEILMMHSTAMKIN